jgi:uncharacterized DUF497 family protein
VSALNPPPGFTWDPDKYRSNIIAHEGVTFDEGALAFADNYIDYASDWRDGELRENIVGIANGRFLFVTYTERGSLIRIISARKAVKKEVDAYFAR